LRKRGSLTALDVSHTRIDVDRLDWLGELPGLRYLNLGHMGTVLSELHSHLRSLGVDQPSVVYPHDDHHHDTSPPHVPALDSPSHRPSEELSRPSTQSMFPREQYPDLYPVRMWRAPRPFAKLAQRCGGGVGMMPWRWRTSIAAREH
jgi:hypothetical protein